jgi:hypothetical protein
MDASSLTAREAAELDALRRLVGRSKIMPGSADWDRYLQLIERSSPPVEPAADGFELDSTPVLPGRGAAAYVLLYADAYSEAVERRLQRWRKLGAEIGIPAPLGDPVALLQWYEAARAAKHLKHAPPDLLLEAAAKAQAPPPSPPASLSPATDAAPPANIEDDYTAEELSSRSVLARLQDDEARLHRRYQTAVAAGSSDAELDVHRRRWSEASELLIMQRARAEKMRELLDPADVHSAIVRFLPALAQALVSGLSAHLPADVAAAAVREAFGKTPATLESLLAA